jgi:predicted nucleotidyltransferase
MNLARPLETVTPTLDGDVLKVLARAEASFTVGQIQQLVGHGARSGLRKVLERLVAQGVVTADRKPAVVLYALNRQHLAADGIVALANLRDAFIRRLSETVESWALRPVQVTLFGSAARGDMRSDSDIDLFIVRPRRVRADSDQWRTQVDELASKSTNWTGNDLRVLEYAELDFVRLQPSEDPVVDAIRADGIVLVGDAGRRRHATPRKFQ